MKRAYRLRRPWHFQRVRRDGRTYSHPLLRLNVLSQQHQQTRCGFVVGKRVGNAVQRNRARRRVREAVRLVFDHIRSGVDIVIVVRTADVATVPFDQLQAVVRQLFERAGIWHEPPATATSEQQATRTHRPRPETD